MTRFEDGPAKGQVLMLQRAPLFLRVSFDGSPGRIALEADKWDALDQVEDSPKASEVLYAYYRTGSHGRAFIDFGGAKKHLSGLYTSASYLYMSEQPPQAVMASNEAWREWTMERRNQALTDLGEQPTVHSGVPPANCRSCNAVIGWLKTKLGKSMPVDFASIAKDDTTTTVYDPTRHVSHYGTCPDAAKWSKKKAKAK